MLTGACVQVHGSGHPNDDPDLQRPGSSVNSSGDALRDLFSGEQPRKSSVGGPRRTEARGGVLGRRLDSKRNLDPRTVDSHSGAGPGNHGATSRRRTDSGHTSRELEGSDRE